MKLLRTSLPVILAIGLMTAGTANAHFIIDIDRKVITPGIFICIDGKVATLRGVVDNRLDKDLLGKSAANLEGVEEVRNYLRVSR